METVIVLIVGVIVGAVVGVLVYRNNSVRFEKALGNIEVRLLDVARRVDLNKDGKLDLRDIEKLLDDKLGFLTKDAKPSNEPG